VGLSDVGGEGRFWDFMSGVCDFEMGSMLKLAKRFNYLIKLS